MKAKKNMTEEIEEIGKCSEKTANKMKELTRNREKWKNDLNWWGPPY